MRKWMVRGPTNRVHYDLTSLDKARKAVREELSDYPGNTAEIYELIEVATNEISPVKLTVVK